jgi:hypothetical protein
VLYEIEIKPSTKGYKTGPGILRAANAPASAFSLWNCAKQGRGHVGIILAIHTADMSRQDILMELEKLMELEQG